MEDKDDTYLRKCLDAVHSWKVHRCEPNYDGFVVIGAGLPRTGTLSIQHALSKLLNGPCYHGYWVLNAIEYEWCHWEHVLNGKASAQNWMDFLEEAES